MPQIQVPTGTGTTVAASTSTDLQTAFVNQILAAAAAMPATSQTIYTPNAALRQTVLLRTPIAIDLPSGVDTIEGGAAVPQAQVVLASSGGTYVTELTQVSIVVAADNTSSTIVNNNLGGGMIAVTGAGQNTIEGLGGANQVITGNGGVDTILLEGGANSLTSNGDDIVQVAGPTTVTAAAGGLVNIQMLNNTTLAFVNQSAVGLPDTVSGASGMIMDLAGPGSTSITAGAGTEYFFVDTSAGNVTLNANPYVTDALTFVRDAPGATANIVVTGLGTASLVAIHGYGGYSITASTTNPANAVLALSDGSRVTFANTAAASVASVLHQE